MNHEKLIDYYGKEFYEKMIGDLKKYQQEWDLSDFEQIEYYSINCLFHCVSKKYGNCVLKIGTHLDSIKNEYNILQEYSGNGFCRIYEADLANGVLLLERVMPGTQLREEADLDVRLNEFCRLFEKIHKESVDKGKYSTYLDWVSNITKYMKGRTDYTELYGKMRKAEQVCCNLWNKYTGRFFLHGDFHHDNILLGEKGYFAIDPKGVIGDVIFDIPRFILNEENWKNRDTFSHIVDTISDKLGILKQDIRDVFYVEVCMAHSWCVEDNNLEEDYMMEILVAEEYRRLK